jgi:6-phosphofructokinase 1
MSRIRDTMRSHERIGVIEVMGNKCGDIALYAGITAARSI